MRQAGDSGKKTLAKFCNRKDKRTGRGPEITEGTGKKDIPDSYVLEWQA